MVKAFFSGLCAFGQFLCTVLLEAADDFFLARDFFLLFVILTELCCLSLLFLLGEDGVVSFIGIELATLDFKNSGHSLIQKVPIMGNEDDGAGVAF